MPETTVSRGLRREYDASTEATNALRILRQGAWSVLQQLITMQHHFEEHVAGEAKVQAYRKSVENLGYANERAVAAFVEGQLITLIDNAVGAANLGIPYQDFVQLIHKAEAAYAQTEATLKEFDAKQVALATQISIEEAD